MSLLAEGQTVAIDILFTPTPLVTSAVWDELRINRYRLLTKRSAAFVGYCRTQANKYGIKGSRVAAAKQAMDFFAICGAIASTTKIRELSHLLPAILGEHTKIMELPTVNGGTETFLECCNRKVPFGSTIKMAHSIFANIYENYGKRAKLAESNEGIDWKALSHAVRVANEAIELLETANVTFPLPNAEHILEIKRGLLPYDAVANEIEGLLEQVEKSAQTSTLPDEVDHDFINEIVCREHRRAVVFDYSNFI